MKKHFLIWKNMTGDPVIDGFSRNPEYHEFFRQCNDAFEFRFAMTPESYLGDGVFKDTFKYEKGRIIPVEGEFKADVVYQFKGIAKETFDNKVKIINTREFKLWCRDKWNQYQLLSDFMSKTFLIEKEEDYAEALQKIMTPKAVLKTRSGQKGENVTVFETNNPPALDSELLKKKGYLLQEFSDTNVTVPGLVSGVHDLKLITIGDHVFANLRTPEFAGSEVCTFDSPYTEVRLSQLPEAVLQLQRKAKALIDEKFPGQIYTIDVGITESGPVIFELNGHTAFPYIHFEYAQEFFRVMIELFQED